MLLVKLQSFDAAYSVRHIIFVKQLTKMGVGGYTFDERHMRYHKKLGGVLMKNLFGFMLTFVMSALLLLVLSGCAAPNTIPESGTPLATSGENAETAIEENTQNNDEFADFKSFWADFRSAVLSQDMEAMQQYVRFPLQTQGMMHYNPIVEFAEDRFSEVFALFLAQDYMLEEGTNLEFFERNSLLKCNNMEGYTNEEESIFDLALVGGDQARASEMIFEKEGEKWLLTFLYLHNYIYDILGIDIDESDVALEAPRPDIGIIPSDIDVPQVVLDAAIDWVWNDYETNYFIENGVEFDNWRLDYLEHAYTYDDLKIEVYRFQWYIHTTTPDMVYNFLAGGMRLDEEGWLLDTYPNSWYLLFESSGDDLKYLTAIMENDCKPGDEVFKRDMIERINQHKRIQNAP
jgi:hypothetical protein